MRQGSDKTPKYETNIENREKSVLPKSGVSGTPKPSLGPEFVFPEGYPVSKTVGMSSDPLSRPTFWSSTNGPECVQLQRSDYLIWRLWTKASDHPDAPKIWAGVKVKGPLGETLHQHASADMPGPQLVLFHLADPRIVAEANEYRRKLGALEFEPVEMVETEDTAMVGLHGVTDGARITKVLHPKNASLLQSLASENAFLVTDDDKCVDIATHTWPIDLDKAVDARACLLAPVKFGDHLGVVAGCYGDVILLKSKECKLVPLQDVQPVMVDPIYRKLIGGI